MGYRGAATVGGLSCVVVLLQALGGFVCPLHKTYVSSGFGFVQLFRFDVYLISWKIDMHTSDLCSVHELSKNSKGESWITGATKAWRKDNPDDPQDFCDWLTSGGDLQEAAQRFCGDALKLLLPSLCAGLQDAFPCGFALLVTMGGNLLCMLAAVGLLLNYAHAAKPKRRYRLNATIILAFSSMCMCGALAVEYLLPLHKLDLGSGIAQTALASNAGGGSGMSLGIAFLGISVAIQLIMVVLCATVAKSDFEINDNDLLAEKAWLQQKEALIKSSQQNAGANSYYGAPESAPGAMFYGAPALGMGMPAADNYGAAVYTPEPAPYYGAPGAGMTIPAADNYGGAAYASYPQADYQHQQSQQASMTPAW